MSELKAGAIETPHNEGMSFNRDSAAPAVRVTEGETEFYLKSEADAYIAELEESHKMEVEQLLILNREQANSANRLRGSMEKAIRRQKYRRCLRIISTCENKMADVFLASPEYINWLTKWRDRWVSIANKFKEEK